MDINGPMFNGYMHATKMLFSRDPAYGLYMFIYQLYHLSCLVDSCCLYKMWVKQCHKQSPSHQHK